MKIRIHPHYAAYESFIRAIPSGEYEREEIYCNRRNTVERVRFGDKEFVIKKYKRPALINCLIYTWFRKSKARRAFEYAELFLQRGIETASPVAYIEIKKNGFFHTGYFISEYIPYPLIGDIGETGMDEEEKQLLTQDLVSFTLQLHLHKIVPLDYNPQQYILSQGRRQVPFCIDRYQPPETGQSPRHQSIHECIQPTERTARGLYEDTTPVCRRKRVRHRRMHLLRLVQPIEVAKEERLQKVHQTQITFLKMSYLCKIEIQKNYARLYYPIHSRRNQT